MEAIVPLIVLAVIGTVMYLSFVQAKKRRERREAVLAALAERIGGRVEPGGWGSQPKLHFEHRGHPARLIYYSTGGKHPTFYTRMFFDLSGRVFKVHVYPEHFFSRVGKALGAQDIQLGDPGFDESFMIKGSDPARVQRFLADAVKGAVRELRAMAGNDHIDVTTDGAALRIQKLSWLEAPDLLRAFCDLGRRVADGYLDAAEAEPDTAGRDARSPAQECPICGHAVTGSAKTCPACAALHHPECWLLNDGCGRCGAA